MFNESPLLLCTGTLIIAVPSMDGLVLAADSRSVIVPAIGKPIAFDSDCKINIPSLPFRTAFCVTGRCAVAYPPIPVAVYRIEEVPRIMMSRQPTFDIISNLKEWLDTSGIENLDLDLVCRLRSKSLEFARSIPAKVTKRLRGHDLFRVVIASYLPHRRVSVIGDWSVNIGRFWGKASATNVSWDEIGENDTRRDVLYGATQYVEAYVTRPPFSILASKLSMKQWQLLQSRKTVGSLRASEALLWAKAVIDSTAETMTTIPHDEPVGGPVDAVLLGTKREPVIMCWKKPPISP